MEFGLDYIQEDPNSTASPPGFSATIKSDKAELILKKDLGQLRRQKAWDIAIAPAKSVPMQGFMMWMSGTTVQIFSVMGVWYLLKGAITSILNYSTPFEQLQGVTQDGQPTEDFSSQKIVFIICQCALLAVGIWKVNAMGILPTRTSDYLEFMSPPVQWKGALEGIDLFPQ